MALIQLDFRSGALNFHEEVSIVLPDKPISTPIPTLWLFHGANADCTEWTRLSSIERYADNAGIAVVMPTVSNGHGQDMVHGMNYWTMVNKELVPAVRYMLPCLSDKREDNFTGGASMGAYVAFRLALNNPDKFCACGAFGGALDIINILSGTASDGFDVLPKDFACAFGSADRLRNTDGDLMYMAKNLVAEGRCPRMWSFVANNDFGIKQVTGAISKFKSIGCDLTDLYDEGIHSYDIWDKYIESFLAWLLNPEVK